MFENIADMNIVIAITALVGVLVMSLIQYGEYANNKVEDKKNVKFCFVPYFLIPLIGVAVSTVGGLFIADTAIDMHYIAGNSQIVGASIVGMLACYSVLDKYCLADIENAVYKLRGYRDRFLNFVADSAKDKVSADDLEKLEEILKIMKK